ncbi:hypothetical protein M3Y94_00152500 [Aphelenchoides besseyi]|nr:hypothetical protein M3Y94_00152500 [Aphelenchoides besseyi]KAI6237147.1 Cysteine-rich motor neuron 1 protein [Aphelenchoides besseyi]
MNAVGLLILILQSLIYTTTRHVPSYCAEVECPDQVVPICSDDSILTRHSTAPESCCELQPTCECDSTRCSQLVVDCEPGFERFRVRQASALPGDCCDEFECRLPADRCRSENCPNLNDVIDLHALAGDSCPNDSFRPPSYIPEDSCCLIVPDCKCRAAVCPPVRCAQDHTAIIEFIGDGIPGRCCDKFRCEKSTDVETGCTVGNRTYAEGENWNPDSCQTCWCNDGVAMCKQSECEPIPLECNWVGHVNGECCPRCLGCQDEDKSRRDVGESWVKDDCTNCTCELGFRTSCQRSFCRTDCDFPKKIPGVCCPVCDSPTIVEPPVVCASVELCPLRCELGLHLNVWGCFECRCADPPTSTVASVGCVNLNEINCDKRCAHGYLRDSNGCATCKCTECPNTESCLKSCLYGFQTNALGCHICKCKSFGDIDKQKVPTTSGLIRESEGCSTRTTNNQLPIIRDSGEWWADSQCRQCFCYAGTEYCSLITCPKRPVDCDEMAWQTRDGDCCPSCSGDPTHKHRPSYHSLAVCHSAGSFYADGETWQLGQSCISCTCRVGHVLCHSNTCQPTPCLTPVPDPNNRCCKYCPDLNLSFSLQINDGVQCVDATGEHAPNSTWRTNDCRSCICGSNGVAHCFIENCPSLPSNCTGRALVIKDACCPICSDLLLSDRRDSCNYHENVYAVGEEFRDGDCRNCTCKLNGIVECVQRQCPRSCEERTAVVLNGCCPECEDTNAYLHEGQTVILENQYLPLSGSLVICIILVVILAFCFCVGIGLLAAQWFYRNQKHRSPLQNCAKSRDLIAFRGANVTLLSDSASDFVSCSLDRSETSTISTNACSSVHSDYDHRQQIPSRFV